MVNQAIPEIESGEPFPFLEYLDTNHAASSEEIPVVKSVISDAQDIVKDIDEELKGYEELIERRKVYMSSIERHSRLLAPIRRMPDDILTAIFHQYFAISGHTAGMTAAHPSVTLSHVCCRWRSLALADPRLWSIIHIRPPAYPYLNVPLSVYNDAVARWNSILEGISERIRIWLARSAKCPLSFSLNASTEMMRGTEPCEVGYLAALVDLICSTSHRWRSADITIIVQVTKQRGPLVDPILKLTPADLPLLQSLKLDVYHEEVEFGDTAESLIPTSSGLMNAPRLRSLSVNVINSVWPGPTIPANWATLTHMVFRGFSHRVPFGEKHMLDILGYCPKLVSLEVQLLNSDQYIPGVAENTVLKVGEAPLTHDHLESLKVISTIPSIPLAHSLDLPALHTLFLNSRTIYNADDPRKASLAHWLTHFGPQLREAAFVESYLSDESMQTVSERLENLIHLHLVSEDTSRQMLLDDFAVLEDAVVPQTPPSEGTPSARPLDASLFPKLVRLTCDMVYGGNVFTEESLVEFIASHRPPTASGKLESVDVKFGSLKTMDIRKVLEERGVNLEGFELMETYLEPTPLSFHSFGRSYGSDDGY